MSEHEDFIERLEAADLDPVSVTSPPHALTREQVERMIEPVTESGCWIWMGGTSKSGYGKLYRGGGCHKAHRIIYEMFHNAKLSDDQCLDHLCRVRCCVNPQHLEAVSHKENVLRGISFSAVNSRKTHCIAGHPLSGNNVYKTGDYRRCKECTKRRGAIYDATKRKR